MTDRPIIFSAPMVRALLDGRKTMTRRIMKLPTKSRGGVPIYEHPKMGGWEPTTIGGGGCFTIGKQGERVPAPEEVAIWHRTCGDVIVPRYQPGDRLWVRENFTLVGGCDPGLPIYAANWREDAKARGFENIPDKAPKWTPCIHMPRWASRLTLIVTAVKVERLQEITEEDAIAEGVTEHPRSTLGFHVPGIEHPNKDFPILCRPTAREMFAALWDTVHDSGAWLANPYVVAISFTVHKRNIDLMPIADAA